jgi:hypothetical protein
MAGEEEELTPYQRGYRDAALTLAAWAKRAAQESKAYALKCSRKNPRRHVQVHMGRNLTPNAYLRKDTYETVQHQAESMAVTPPYDKPEKP